jgi:hypothetical protein
MQAWIVPGAPFVDGWRLWYATDGAPPSSPRVSWRGQSLSVQFDVSPPLSLPGFSRTVFHARLRTPAQLPPGAEASVFIPETGETHRWSTLPATLPPEGLSFVFGSCYWREADKGAVLRALKDIISIESPRPLFKLLLGDQLYLDWPPDVAPWKLAKGGTALVADRYRDYWGDDDYRRFLGLLPNLVVCDDHEFWNNYPELQLQLPITYSSKLRHEFAAAAARYYQDFQACLNQSKLTDPPQAWTELQLGPVSLFIADTRSQRSLHGAKEPQLMAAEQWAALEAWQRGLRGPGLLALGQPLLQCDGNFTDYALSNFVADYRRLLALLEASAKGINTEGKPHNIVILSGDIHNARCTYATIPCMPAATAASSDLRRVHELVASASSTLVTGIGKPQPGKLPGTIPEGKADRTFRNRWKVQPVEDTVPYAAPPLPNAPYACVDNNIGVLRLQPSATTSGGVTLRYLSYRIRPHHGSLLQRIVKPEEAAQGTTEIYSCTLELQ